MDWDNFVKQNNFLEGILIINEMTRNVYGVLERMAYDSKTGTATIFLRDVVEINQGFRPKLLAVAEYNFVAKSLEHIGEGPAVKFRISSPAGQMMVIPSWVFAPIAAAASASSIAEVAPKIHT